MRLHAALVALAMTVAASASAAAQCMQDNQPDQIAEGTLSLGQFEDAAGGAEQAFILTLPVPTCLSGGEADGAVGSTTTIHVYSFDSAVSGGVGESHRTKRAGARHAVQRAHCPSPRADRHGRELDRRDLSVSYSRCAIFFSLILQVV